MEISLKKDIAFLKEMKSRLEEYQSKMDSTQLDMVFQMIDDWREELEALHKADDKHRQTAYVAMNENDFDVENMSFYKTLKRAEKEWGDRQKYMKVKMTFEDVYECGANGG